jgi:FlaA1/EpsC-like NDP-sugar epimerase
MMRRVLIYGAGEAGIMVLEEILKHPEEQMMVFGFVDDDPSKNGKRFHGVKVLGGKHSLVGRIRDLDINEVIVAMPSIGMGAVRDVVKVCKSEKVKLLVVPSTREIIEGAVRFDQIKSLDLADLLDREEVKIDTERIRASVEGERVLVTGAAGSIGSALVAELLRYHPATVVALDLSENGLFYLTHRMKGSVERGGTKLVPCVADIKDRRILEEIFTHYAPQAIFHAAAYKHVPLMESHQRIVILNNVVGCKNLLELSEETGVERFIAISTDKAVRPVSVMGKTKRICELMVGAFASRGLKACCVRFGNVLGSEGSVVAVFKEQIARGGPLTITSPSMERFFMTVSEATSLVLQAASMGEGGSIYVLDMGKPIKIKDLAENLIVLSGFTPEADIKINYTGLREGERLSETLFYDDSIVRPSGYDGIAVERSVVDCEEVLKKVQTLSDAVYDLTSEQMSDIMDAIVSCARVQSSVPLKQAAGAGF